MEDVSGRTEGRTSDEGLKATALIDEHRRLGARLADFAGWEMPLWYSGASEEHAAVRTAAGLFDIGHMGLLEVTGREGAEHLDLLTTVRVPPIEVGRCHYTFLLDYAGLPIDDIIIGRLAGDRFLLVVNAANAAEVREWLGGVAAGATPLEDDVSGSTREFDLTLRDLSAGDDALTGMALQGPLSADVLAALMDAPADLRGLGRFELAQTSVLGAPAIVSRTGYTGETVGYEVFVSVNSAPEVWRGILEAGDESGVLPAGLAARDSLRVEAGLPLYGHELAGPHKITPLGAGYARFVDFSKDFFVGREALLEREADRACEIVRFRLDRESARAIRGEDPVGSRRGQMVGWVTSCALVGATQVGMAWVERSVAGIGTELLLYPARLLERSVDVSDVSALQPGDRLPMHEAARVLPRFPR